MCEEASIRLGLMPLIERDDRTVPVTVQSRTSLSPSDAFRIIAPIDLSLVFGGWGPFPGVRGATNQVGDWDAAGQTRNPDLTDGSTALERLVEYTNPSSFAYELTNFTNILRHLIRGARGEWTFSPDGSGTVIRWTYEFQPRAGRMLLVGRLLGPLWKRYMQVAVHRAARAAESSFERQSGNR